MIDTDSEDDDIPLASIVKATSKPQPKRKPSKEEDEENVKVKTKKKAKTTSTIVTKDQWQPHLDGRNPTLQEIQDMMKAMSATTSLLEKKETLRKFPHCVKALLYSNHPFWQFGVTGKGITSAFGHKKFDEMLSLSKPSRDIFHLLDQLRDRTVTGHAALGTACRFVTENKRYEQVILCLIDKDLKMRCKTPIINAVFEELIPTWSVALAYAYEQATEVDFLKGMWYASRKYDGCRVIMVVSEDSVECRFREGDRILVTGEMEEKAKELGLPVGVYDGEACQIDPVTGKEDFQGIVSAIRKEVGTLKNCTFMFWDMLTPEEFSECTSKRVYSERFGELCLILNARPGAKKWFRIAEQTLVKDPAHLLKMTDDATAKGYEGLMIRKDVGYEGKRTKNLLKLKKFIDGEYKVVRTENSKQRHVIDGKDTECDMLANVVIVHEGFEVGVGSGFDREERLLYAKHPEKIVGCWIAIKHFGESTNKKGGKSLRFPSFYFNYGKQKRNI